MVNTPVVATFAEVLPLTVPINALESTAILAGPPRKCPVRLMAKSLKKVDTPVTPKKAPKRTKVYIYVADTPVTKPNRPSDERYNSSMIPVTERPACTKGPGIYMPK